MHTYFLGDAEVGSYAADLAARLVHLGEQAPRTWVSLGISGDKMTAEILKRVLGTSAEPDAIHSVAFDRTKKEVISREDGELPSDLGDRSVLVIDAAIHSGASMRHLVEALNARGCRSLLSYSLVVKITSEFVPCYFGLMIGEHDRAFFQLDRIPNNRLLQRAPFGAVRMLREDDIRREPDFLTCGVKSIDRMTYGDLWYDTRTKGSHVYLYEIGGEVAGYIHFKRTPENRLFIDLIANGVAFQGQGIGGVLMRWAETYARAARMTAIDLWSIEARMGFYSHHGYVAQGERMDLGGEGEVYHLMRRRLLYNLKPQDLHVQAA